MGRIAVSSGMVGEPSYTFKGELDTGFYIVEPSKMGIAASGTGVAEFSVSGAYFPQGAYLPDVKSINVGGSTNPSHTFVNDLTTGLYLVESGKMGIAASGVQAAEFSPSGMYCPNGIYLSDAKTINDGTVGGPSHTFQNDTTTGLYLVESGKMGIAASGVQAAEFSPSGMYVVNAIWCDSIHSTSIICAVSGTSSWPGLTFNEDLTTGLYLVESGKMGIAASGTSIAEFSVSGAYFPQGTYLPDVKSINDGSSTNPSHTFQNDITTGLYLLESGKMGIAASGASIAEFSVSGMYVPNGIYLEDAKTINDGTVGGPSHTFQNDTTTGLYLVESGKMGIAASGTSIAEFSPSGMYLPQETWLNSNLHGNYILSSGTQNNPGLSFEADNATGMYLVESGKMGIAASGVKAAEFDSQGTYLSICPSDTGVALVRNTVGQICEDSSSQRYKENILNIDFDPKKVLNLRQVSFDWKSNNKHDFGLIAEEVNNILPQLVHCDKDGRPNSVKYDRIGALLIQPVLEHDNDIKQLKQEIAELKARIGS